MKKTKRKDFRNYLVISLLILVGTVLILSIYKQITAKPVLDMTDFHVEIVDTGQEVVLRFENNSIYSIFDVNVTYASTFNRETEEYDPFKDFRQEYEKYYKSEHEESTAVHDYLIGLKTRFITLISSKEYVEEPIGKLLYLDNDNFYDLGFEMMPTKEQVSYMAPKEISFYIVDEKGKIYNVIFDYNESEKSFVRKANDLRMNKWPKDEILKDVPTIESDNIIIKDISSRRAEFYVYDFSKAQYEQYVATLVNDLSSYQTSEEKYSIDYLGIRDYHWLSGVKSNEYEIKLGYYLLDKILMVEVIKI
ncbi:MAG: hypothetical protein IJO63_01875 [Bacilli bacterium]|nr:hypothetical protein [Bacilli bacterium]